MRKPEVRTGRTEASEIGIEIFKDQMRGKIERRRYSIAVHLDQWVGRFPKGIGISLPILIY